MAGRGSLAGKQFVVTGAASGIGAAVAEQLGAAGAVLHLTDRNAVGLKEIRASIEAAGGTVATATAADVTSIDEVRAFADEVHSGTGAVDGVLNVAGIAIWGTVDKMAHEQWRAVIEVNLMGPIHVIESFVPAMIAERRGGYLVNVSSAAGLVGLPWHAAYSASKFGLRGLSEVLRFDLARHKIAVSLVTPGAVATPLTGTVQLAGVDTSTAQFQKMRARFEHRAVSADTAATKIIDGMLARKYLVHTSRDIQALHAVQRYVPPVYSLMMHGANRVATRVMKRLA
jgi:NAD(P)-dependent dehydrogenase (short-subunit alcohol dehydrogenase family)